MFMGFLQKEQKSLPEMTGTDIQKFTQLLHRKNYAPATVNIYLTGVKSFMLWMHEYYHTRNLSDWFIFCKRPIRLPKYVTKQKIFQLLRYLESNKEKNALRNKVIITLLYITGMRVGELSSLLINNINFENRTILIYGKGNKERILPFPDIFLPVLQEYMNTYVISIYGTTRKTYDYLFPVFSKGTIKPISTKSVYYLLKTLSKKANIGESLHPHQLRHSLATHLLHNGVKIYEIQRVLGHVSIETTQIYAAVDINHLKIAYRKSHCRA